MNLPLHIKKGILFLSTISFLVLTHSNSSFAQKSSIETSGDILQIALPAAAFTSTLIWNDEYKGSIQFIKTMATTVAVTYALKLSISKPRPNGGNYSFPSGHTSSAFTGAAFLERRYGWKVGIPAYLLAGYVGWTRVDANKHDYWDILGGAIVGTLSAYLFTKPYNSNIQIAMGKNQNYYSLRICYKL